MRKRIRLSGALVRIASRRPGPAAGSAFRATPRACHERIDGTGHRVAARPREITPVPVTAHARSQPSARRIISRPASRLPTGSAYAAPRALRSRSDVHPRLMWRSVCLASKRTAKAGEMSVNGLARTGLSGIAPPRPPAGCAPPPPDPPFHQDRSAQPHSHGNRDERQHPKSSSDGQREQRQQSREHGILEQISPPATKVPDAPTPLEDRRPPRSCWRRAGAGRRDRGPRVWGRTWMVCRSRADVRLPDRTGPATRLRSVA